MQNINLVNGLRQWFYAERTYTAIPERLELFEDTIIGLQMLCDKEGIKAEIKTEHPEIPLGDMFIFIESKHPIIHDTERLAELISRMKNFELYSLPDGRTRFGARFANVYSVEVSKN